MVTGKSDSSRFFSRILELTECFSPCTVLLRAICLFQLIWVAFSVTAAEPEPNTTIPLWQQGVSSWSGQGYLMPEATSPASTGATTPPVVANPSSLQAYTVPVDPSLSLEAAESSPPVSLASVAFALPNTDDASPPPSAGPVSTDGVLPPPVNNFDMLSEPIDDDWDANSSRSDSLSGQSIGDSSINQPLGSALMPTPEPSISAEQPPLQESVLRWYQYPASWIKGWKNHAEFGLNGSSGNAETLAMQTGLEMKRQAEKSTWAIDLDYRLATTRGVTTEDNGRFNLDYDRLLADSQWSLFGKYGMEWDEFKAFDLRINLNSGLGYYWIRSEDTTLATRFGAGASREIGAPIDEWTPEAVFGIEAEHQLTSRQKVKAKVDYFPAWEDFSDYRLVSDFAWEILLDSSDNLSLKLGLSNRYDSTPQGAEPNDFYYSLLLLYKF